MSKTPPISDFKAMTIKESYEAVKTPDNLSKFRFLLAQNIPLKTICEVHFGLPYKNRKDAIRRLPELAQELEAQKVAQRLAYRLIIGFDWKEKKGTIAITADTPDEIWYSGYIKKYFEFYQENPSRYKANYLKDLHHKGVHYLSNLYAIAHCELSRTGRILIEFPEPQNDPE